MWAKANLWAERVKFVGKNFLGADRVKFVGRKSKFVGSINNMCEIYSWCWVSNLYGVAKNNTKIYFTIVFVWMSYSLKFLFLNWNFFWNKSASFLCVISPHRHRISVEINLQKWLMSNTLKLKTRKMKKERKIEIM